MRLDQTLVYRKLVSSRTEAKSCIEEGFVFVNEEVCIKVAKEIQEFDHVHIVKTRRFVSRSGEKLEGVLYDIFADEKSVRKHLAGKVALDVGSSTGGFTECLLCYGVAHIDAVDVGTLQLHPKLRNHKSVNVYENTDIRNFSTTTHYDVIVVDVSFISLKQILTHICSLGHSGTRYIILIKPQFEVGKGNTKHGIVKDEMKVKSVIDMYKDLCTYYGIRDVSLHTSKVVGKEGNQEYFIFGIMEKRKYP